MTFPRTLRLALIAIAVLLILAIGGGAVFLARFDPNTLKPRIIEAVKHATGRDLALNGPISLKPSLWPTVQVADVAFANPPGFSRPQMATLQGLELQLALLPLLSGHYEIDRLVLIRPDILLETNAAGQPNWKMKPEAAPTAPAGSQAPAAPGGKKAVVSIDTVQIQDGLLAYRDDRTGKVTTLGLPRLNAQAAAPDAPLHLDADGSYDNTAFHLVADTGSLTRLQDAAATTPWPVKLTLSAAGATLVADGALTHPLQGKGYDLAVNGTIPDLPALGPLLRDRNLPPLHDVRFAAKVADSGGAIPAISSLTLHAGASDLGAQMPGFTLASLDVAAAAADQPVKANGAGTLDGKPVTLAATTGPLAALLPGAAPASFPVDATLQAAGATISAKGTIADAHAMTGANLALAVQAPDLAALSPLARRPLPALKNVAFHGTLTDAAGGFRNGAALHGMALTSAEGDVAGDIAVGLGARPTLTAALKSNRIDLDAIQTTAGPAPKAATPPPAPGNPPPPPPRRGNGLIPDQPLPFGALRAADADVRLDLGLLRSGGADYKAIQTHVVLANGKLAVNPFSADTPGGRLSGSLSADATKPAPPVHLVLRAPGLALKSLLALVGEPALASGNMEVRADLSGAGPSPHAIAASLDGTLGLALAGGTIDNRLLGSMLGKVLNAVNALDLVGRGGTSDLRCFAMRMDAKHGIGTIQPLALASSLLTMTGSGTVNLGTETLAMQLRPQARVGGTEVVIPVDVNGPMLDPRVGVNQAGAAEANIGTIAGALMGKNPTLPGPFHGIIGGEKLADPCPAALALARGQAAPAAAAAAAPKAPAQGAPAQGAPPLPVNPQTILKNLFR
jgi:AsmA protein